MSTAFIFNQERDIWLNSTDAELEKSCRRNCFTGSGRGGQKRNKTSNAVRFTHEPSGIAVSDCSGRSQHHNRGRALAKLRREIALQVRMSPGTVPSRPEVSRHNPEYPLFTAHILDLLNEHDFIISDTASILGISTARLLKILQRDPKLWQLVQGFRCNAGRSEISEIG
ncbi:MAG: peptide chain release factor-like protein [Victivallales bacterium]|nr:peptide chain release factor-like protein [Victivallales bacterium]